MYIFLFFLACLSITFVFVKKIPQLRLALIQETDEDAADQRQDDDCNHYHDPDGDPFVLLLLLAYDRQTRLHITIETDRLSGVVV